MRWARHPRAWPIVAVFVLSSPAGCAGIPRDAENYRATATVRTLRDETMLVATVNPLQRGHGMFGRTWERHSLRARIDPHDRRTSFELLEVISYRARKLRGFETLRYETPAGTQRRSVQPFKTDRDCARYRSGVVCRYLEHFAVEISEPLLRQAASGRPRSAFWEWEFHSRSGEQYATKTPIAEIEGLLRRIDDVLGAPEPL